MVERPLREREVVGSIPGRAIPKALKMVPVATLFCAQHYKEAQALLSLTTNTTNIAQKVTLGSRNPSYVPFCRWGTIMFSSTVVHLIRNRPTDLPKCTEIFSIICSADLLPKNCKIIFQPYCSLC